MIEQPERPEIEVTEEMRQEIRGALAELDPAQIAIESKRTPGQRLRRAFAMSDAVRRIAVRRLRQLHPELSALEAHRLVLERYYANEAGRHE